MTTADKREVFPVPAYPFRIKTGLSSEGFWKKSSIFTKKLAWPRVGLKGKLFRSNSEGAGDGEVSLFIARRKYMSEDKISKEIESKFGHHLRIRVNGVLIEDDKILLVKHKMSTNRDFWSTPGGGMQFGSSAQENLVREFLEETGLKITVGEFLFVHEYLDSPLHAIECFFLVKRISGTVTLGEDPELAGADQILTDISWKTLEGLSSLEKKSIHPVFLGIKSLSELVLYKGYFNFGNKYLK